MANRAGLEGAAQVSYRYNPARESIAFHAVRVWRDGVAVDRLASLEFSTARQEPDLASGVVDGEITVFAELTDIRVGDIVDIEVSWRIRDLLWPDGFSTAFSTQWSVPIGVARFRLLAPAERAISTRMFGPPVEIALSSVDGMTERTWRTTDPDPVPGESNTPSHHPTWGYVAVSTMATWEEVTAWARSAFDVDMTLDPTTQREVDRIRARSANPDDWITDALRHVQDRIRYVGDEVGLGSHVPRPPAEVAVRGFGDCKDKSLLLTAMLRQLGLEAYPALTDLDKGHGLPDALPSPYAFDHAIVQVIVDGESYWLDPTLTHQGGRFPHLAQPTFGYALPVRRGREGLVAIELREPAGPQIEVDESFDLGAAPNGSAVTLSVHTTYRGREADRFRRRLDANGRDAVAEQFRTYYQDLYPTLEPHSALALRDELDANVITVDEAYWVLRDRADGEALLSAFPLRGDGVLGVATTPGARQRRTPLALPYPVARRHSFALFHARKPLFGLPDYVGDDGGLRFSSRSTSSRDGVHVELELVTRTAAVAAADVAAYAEIADAVEEYSNLTIDLRPPPAGLAWFTAATADWTDAQVEAAATAFIIVVYGAASLLGAVIGLRADARYAGVQVFHPVSAIKFAVMSLATFGIYSMLWMWRCWRWVKADSPRAMSPFGRALFGGFYYYALFDEIRRRAQGPAALTLVGVLLAALYLGSSVAARVLERAASMEVLSLVVGLAGVLALLPLVVSVNWLNRDHADALKHHSRWRVRTFAALLLGASFWALVIFGSAAQ